MPGTAAVRGEGRDTWSPPRVRGTARAAQEADLTGRRPLGLGVDGVEGLAGGHEEAVSLGAAEADVAADLREPDAPDELALRSPDRHAAIAHAAPGVAGAPHVAVDVAARPVGPALDPVDHEV